MAVVPLMSESRLRLPRDGRRVLSFYRGHRIHTASRNGQPRWRRAALRLRASGTFPNATNVEQRLEAALKRMERLEATVKRMEESINDLAQDIRFQRALSVLPDDSSSSSSSSESSMSSGEERLTPTSSSVAGRVTVCMGKDCQKQGSKDLLKKVESVMTSHPEMNNVTVKTCKCLDECGKGPVISAKFGKKKGQKHKKVKGKAVESLLLKQMHKAE